ncbi:MAG TPA: hypothetical protein PLO62_04750 [Candidatus Hydrogenedentes bacterium]|nr:hypothetical protein [Candidatus Hydrogenedentota bacterium]HOS03176.1 hypothetical protein [Candidatus Hydrogenedentota bacterium]
MPERSTFHADRHNFPYLFVMTWFISCKHPSPMPEIGFPLPGALI